MKLPVFVGRILGLLLGTIWECETEKGGDFHIFCDLAVLKGVEDRTSLFIIFICS